MRDFKTHQVSVWGGGKKYKTDLNKSQYSFKGYPKTLALKVPHQCPSHKNKGSFFRQLWGGPGRLAGPPWVRHRAQMLVLFWVPLGHQWHS